LSQLRKTDVEEFFALTDHNRRYLRKYLPWLDSVKTAHDTLNFVKAAITQYHIMASGRNAIHHCRSLSGVIGFHPFDRKNRIAEIGYWRSEDKQGKGIVTACMPCTQF